MHVHTRALAHTHTHMHACMQSLTHTHTHTHTHTQSFRSLTFSDAVAMTLPLWLMARQAIPPSWALMMIGDTVVPSFSWFKSYNSPQRSKQHWWWWWWKVQFFSSLFHNLLTVLPTVAYWCWQPQNAWTMLNTVKSQGAKKLLTDVV